MRSLDTIQPRNRLALVLSLACTAGAACNGGHTGASLPRVDLDAIEPEVAGRIEAVLAELEADSEHVESWRGLGLLYEANDFQKAAAEAYRQALERSQDPKLWYRLGIVLSGAGEREQAVAAMSRCVALKADYAPAHWRLGSYYFDVNDFDNAERSFLRARELDPKHLGGWTGLARVQLQREEAEAALATLQGALKLKPRAPLVRKLLRTAYFETGQIEAARALHVPWERPGSMGGDPWQRELRALRVKPPMELALERLQGGNPAGAVEVLEPFVRDNPSDPNAYAYLASAYLALGRVNDGKESVAKGLEQDPESTLVLRVQASLHLAANDVEAALEVYAKILSIDSLDLAAWRQKGDLEARLGRDAEAIASWNQVVRFDERDDELLARIAATRARLEQAENP